MRYVCSSSCGPKRVCASCNSAISRHTHIDLGTRSHAASHTPLSPESKKSTWVACNPEGVQWVCLSPLVCRTTVGDVPTPGPAVACVCLCVRVNEETHMHDVFSPARTAKSAHAHSGLPLALLCPPHHHAMVGHTQTQHRRDWSCLYLDMAKSLAFMGIIYAYVKGSSVNWCRRVLTCMVSCTASPFICKCSGQKV